MREPHRKDIERPEKYDGNTDHWLRWSRAFKRFLRRIEPKWAVLLEHVEALRGKPVTPLHEEQWSAEMGLGPVIRWNDQLNEYLEAFTKGPARVIVDSFGETRALDAWRVLSDKGNSLRLAHANVLRRKAFFPRAGVAAKDLEPAIAAWEADIDRYQGATGEAFPEANRRMSMEDMCPEKLRAHLKAQGADRFPTCEELKIEISDWLFDEVKKGGLQAKGDKDKHIGSIENPEDNGEEEYEEAQMYSTEWDCWICGLAPKRPRTETTAGEDADMPPAQEFQSTGKGGKNGTNCKGKGKGKGGKKLACWTCGGEHYQRDCPLGGAAAATPLPAAWKSWYPGQQQFHGPSTQVWNSWMPKGKGKASKGAKAKGKGSKGKGIGAVDPMYGFPPLGAMNWGGPLAAVYAVQVPDNSSIDETQNPNAKQRHKMQAPMKHAIDVRNAFDALTVDVDADDLENVTVPDNATKVWNMHTEQSEQTIAPPSSPITKLDFEISDFPFEISDFPLEISATRDPSQVRGRAPVSITDLIVNRESQSARRQVRKAMKV